MNRIRTERKNCIVEHHKSVAGNLGKSLLIVRSAWSSPEEVRPCAASRPRMTSWIRIKFSVSFIRSFLSEECGIHSSSVLPVGKAHTGWPWPQLCPWGQSVDRQPVLKRFRHLASTGYSQPAPHTSRSWTDCHALVQQQMGSRDKTWKGRPPHWRGTEAPYTHRAMDSTAAQTRPAAWTPKLSTHFYFKFRLKINTLSDGRPISTLHTKQSILFYRSSTKFTPFTKFIALQVTQRAS